MGAVWNLSVLNAESLDRERMKMAICFVAINGMHPFLGMDCDSNPNCLDGTPIVDGCRIKRLFEKLLQSEYSNDQCTGYGFSYRDAWKMETEREHFLSIDMAETAQLLSGEDEDGLRSFRNEPFSLFSFKNECDFSYKIQFDMV